MDKANFTLSKEEYEALEFVSKQVIVFPKNAKPIKLKTKPILTQEEKDAYPIEFDNLFIELFGKEEFDRCPTFMDKIEFIAEHWDSLQ